jgi:HD superfamily phosphodiesterase
MVGRKLNFSVAIDSRYPGLIEEVRRIIVDSERRYEGASGKTESFLWEHSIHVASLAYQLAVAEDRDPLMPAIAALFHDAGKFDQGQYHQDQEPEEEKAVRIAEGVLRSHKMKPASVRQVVSGLRALYFENANKNAVARILHDADFLSKFGALGVAVFFIKSALRGKTLSSAVMGSLSKELTYAACLPLNMHTTAGRRLAARKAAGSMKFFSSLLDELREAGIANLHVRKLRIPGLDQKGKRLVVRIVSPMDCTQCGGEWNLDWAIEEGIKCRRLILESTCANCGNSAENSFCLPEVTGG